MESPSRFVVWEVQGFDQRGLVIDPKHAKLLDDVGKTGSGFDHFVKRLRVQSLLGWVRQRFGHSPAGGPAPPLRSRENDMQGAVTEAQDEDGRDERKADE